MIEVLTSVFVLAIGVVGAAGMQLTALRTAQQSAFQTVAVQLASELADKLRTNVHQEMRTGNASPLLDFGYASATDTVPVPDILCFAADCSSEDLAKFELYEWKTRIKAVLPGGRARICHDAMPWDHAAAAFTWNCTASLAGTAGTPLVIKIGWEGKGTNPGGSAKRDIEKNFPPSIAITVASYKK